jgi:hypothetical protein
VTAVKKHHRDLVEAIASRESEKARQLSEALPSEEYQEYGQYLAAVFAIFMEDFFGDKLSRDTIAGFAKRLGEDFRAAGVEYDQTLVENVIRASAGEVSLYENLSSGDIVSTQVMIIGRLGVQGTSVRPDLDRFLNEAEELVTEWEREDQ